MTRAQADAIKPFIAQMMMFLSLILSLTTTRYIGARYFGGPWLMVWIGAGVSFCMLLMLLKGTQAIYREASQEKCPYPVPTAPKSNSDTLHLIVSAAYVGVIGITIYDAIAYLRTPVLSFGTKGAVFFVTIVAALSAAAHLHFTLLSWLQKRRKVLSPLRLR